MLATATKTLTAVIDGAGDALSTIYGAVGAERVGVGVNGRSFTDAMDARIVAEGYRRIGEWTKRGPLNYSADIEADAQRCQTCVSGCECEPGTPGCGHYGCWYATDEVAHTCPGVKAFARTS